MLTLQCTVLSLTARTSSPCLNSPKQDTSRRSLNQGVDTKTDQRDTPGSGPASDGDSAFNQIPENREIFQMNSAFQLLGATHHVPYLYLRGLSGNILISAIPATNPPTCAQNAIPPPVSLVYATEVAAPLRNCVRNQ